MMEPGVVAKFTKDNLPDWFCPVPFASLIFNPFGNVGVCREQGRENHPAGQITEQSIEEIWNSESIRSWRREFLTGNIKTCANNIRDRKCNKAKFNQELIKHIDLQEYQTKPPSRISPDFNGQCNLECPMCHSWTEPNGLYDKIDFWEKAKVSLFPYVKQIDPLSGEPFVQKDTYRLMDIMGEVNPEAVWRITTNGHWKFTPFVKEKLDKIRIGAINISLDSISEENYPIVRKNGNLKVVLRLIDDLIEYRNERAKKKRSFEIDINTTIQRANCKELGEFVKFAQSKGAVPLIQLLYEPTKYSLLTLSEKDRLELLQFYVSTIPWEQLKFCRRVIIPLIDSLPNHDFKKYDENFKNVGSCAIELK
jgi:MoaA/NifB/PqqE/SkfB family radical SAM enzyme